jgi:hypothetical protein
MLDSLLQDMAQDSRDYTPLMLAAWFEDGYATGFSVGYAYGQGGEKDMARLPQIETEISARLETVRLDCAVGLAYGVGYATEGYAL